jgi:hypothetical protein
MDPEDKAGDEEDEESREAAWAAQGCLPRKSRASRRGSRRATLNESGTCPAGDGHHAGTVPIRAADANEIGQALGDEHL